MKNLLNQNINEVDVKVCSRCIYDERVPFINFVSDGVCNYCHQVDSLIEQYGTGQPKGEDQFSKVPDSINRAGKAKPYDCIMGVSGGTDSSYLVYLARQWGLRPLAVHYDENELVD